MYHIPQVNDSTWYLGVNDREKSLFENLWPLPEGVAYNAYLIKDEKNVLIDTVDVCYSDRFLKRLEQLLEGADLHYLVVDHMEPDHSGSLRLLREKYPRVEIVANKKAADMLQGFYDITEGVKIVKETDKLHIGSRELSFVFAPMVHWPEVMFTYDPKEKALFSADAFGAFGTLDGGLFDEEVDRQRILEDVYRYYSNIVGKYGAFTQKALQKCAGLEIEYICSTHGPIWHKYASEIIELYDKVSGNKWETGLTIIYGSMYGHTEELAEIIARSVAHHGVKKVKLCNVAKTHASYILADIFKYKGVMIGSPTYNNELHPYVESAMRMIESRGVKDKVYACFGSFAWGPVALKLLKPFHETMKWEAIEDHGMEIKMEMKSSDEDKAWELGRRMAEKLLAEEKA